MSQAFHETARVKAMENPWLSGQTFSSDITAQIGIKISQQTMNHIRRFIHFHAQSISRKRPKMSIDNIEQKKK
jgi:trans-2-enoyl-CoA reductase